MKLKDFTFQTRNVADDGKPYKEGVWKSGSQSNLMAIGVCSGKKYQVKIRAGAPKWFNVDDAIAAKRREIASASADDLDRLNSELSSLEKNRDRYNSEDRKSDEFLAAKNEIFRKVKSSGNPLLATSESIWKEPIEFKGNATYSVEASPWVDPAVGFEDGDRIVFKNLTLDEKYSIIASMAEALAALHAVGVIHGDLKRGNTVITRAGSEYKVALIDYDASFILDDLKSGKYCYDTWKKLLGGTFFSPETIQLITLIEGEQEFKDHDKSEISFKSDIFALGVTVYEYMYQRADHNVMPYASPEGEKLTTAEYALYTRYADCKPDFPKEPDCPTMDGFLYGMLNWMMDADPSKRPDAATVASLFRSRDESKIPAEYCRINLFEPDPADEIEFIPTEGVVIERILNKPGRYFVKKGSMKINCDVKRLVSDGYARYVGAAASAAEAVASAAADKDKPWQSDGMDGTTLPPCITRSAGKDGFYVLITGFSRRECDMAKLRSLGFFCAEAEQITFWPDDAAMNPDVHIKPEYVAIRDFKKGPGNYRVLSKRDYDSGRRVFATNCTFKNLVTSGYAVEGALPEASKITVTEPYKEDGIAYVLEAIPQEVASITRDAIRGAGHYNVKMKDSTLKKMTAAELVDLGWAKRNV